MNNVMRSVGCCSAASHATRRRRSALSPRAAGTARTRNTHACRRVARGAARECAPRTKTPSAARPRRAAVGAPRVRCSTCMSCHAMRRRASSRAARRYVRHGQWRGGGRLAGAAEVRVAGYHARARSCSRALSMPRAPRSFVSLLLRMRVGE